MPFDMPIARIEFDRHFHLRLARLIRHIAKPVMSGALPPLLRALADDLDAVQAGDAPNDQTLARAPLLHDWTLVSAPDGVRLEGVVEGHPIFGSRPISHLAALVAQHREKLGEEPIKILSPRVGRVACRRRRSRSPLRNSCASALRDA